MRAKINDIPLELAIYVHGIYQNYAQICESIDIHKYLLTSTAFRAECRR